MFFPPLWTMNPTGTPPFVPTTPSMGQPSSSSSGENLPRYTPTQPDLPPAYAQSFAEALAMPKNVFTRLVCRQQAIVSERSRLARRGISLEDHENIDLETGNILPRTETARRTRRDNLDAAGVHITTLDTFTYLIVLFAFIFWPTNMFAEFTGRLCEKLISKIVFCGLPSIALFFIWISTFQMKGFWAIKREGKTYDTYVKHKTVRQSMTFLAMVLAAVGLTLVMYWICDEGCSTVLAGDKWCVVS